MKITTEELRELVRETIFQEKSKRKKRSKKYFNRKRDLFITAIS